MRISMGWLTCVPFDYDPMTGEPIVQCNSISDQMPCDAGVPQFPGEGYCPSTVNGYVDELFFRLPGVAGLRGLGRPYWDYPGGFAPPEMVAADNNMPALSQATIQAIDAQRMAQITNGAIQNYMGAALRSPLPQFQPGPAPSQPTPAQPLAVRVVRSPSGLPSEDTATAAMLRARRGIRGLGDCLATQVDSGGSCPDGSAYTGALDSGGAGANACFAPYTFINGVCTLVPNYAAEATAAGLGPAPTPSPGTPASTLPLSLPALMLPPGVTANPAGLKTNIVCPTGYANVGGVCSPVAAPASQTNWLLIGGGILAAVVVIAMVAKR